MARLLPLLAVLAFLAVVSCTAAAAKPSPLFGKAGELWKPTGLPDFSFAGYRFSDAQLPAPQLTRSLDEFRRQGGSDSQAIANMVAWGNAQPESAGWVVLGLPAGNLTLEQQVVLRRPRTVLRGAGAAATELYLPHSLTDLLGKNTASGGYYVYSGALLSVRGDLPNEVQLAQVDAATPVPRGSFTLRVDSAAKLAAGDIVSLKLNDGNGTLGREIMNNSLQPGSRNSNGPLYFASRIRAISGQTVTLERAVPLTIRSAMQPSLVRRAPTLTHVGLEGFTMHFKHTTYLGHHHELGMNGVELEHVADCWATDLAFVNVDSAVLLSDAERVTLRGIDVGVSAPRRGPVEGRDAVSFDGHWGVRVGSSRDVLLQGFREHSHMAHSVGADARGAFSVFSDCRMQFGTLEMHRAQSTQCLFTDIDVGNPMHSFYNGGPEASGPNTGAWTVYWNIRSATGSHPLPDHNGRNMPGDCTFGGAPLFFVGVRFMGAHTLCSKYVYQPEPVTPPNLFLAQLARRTTAGSQSANLAGVEDDATAVAGAPAPQQEQQQEVAPTPAPAKAPQLL